jgi:hypothetical protein
MAGQPTQGEFSLKATSVTMIPGQTADSVLSQVSFEGPVTPGIGMCFATNVHDFGGGRNFQLMREVMSR